MATKMYLISPELLRETISGLNVFGKEAVANTVEKLEDLEVHWIEEEEGGIPDVDSV